MLCRISTGNLSAKILHFSENHHKWTKKYNLIHALFMYIKRTEKIV